MDLGCEPFHTFLLIFNIVIHLCTMEQMIHQYSAYDLWANTRIIERLQREGETVLDRHVKSSFPSLRLTIGHIRDAGGTWFGRLFACDSPVFAEGIGGLVQGSVAMNDKVRALDNEALLEAVAYVRGGVRYVQPRWQMLLHCFNHASYHRGQIITMMRQLDLGEVPNTDLVAYQRLLSAPAR